MRRELREVSGRSGGQGQKGKAEGFAPTRYHLLQVTAPRFSEYKPCASAYGMMDELEAFTAQQLGSGFCGVVIRGSLFFRFVATTLRRRRGRTRGEIRNVSSLPLTTKTIIYIYIYRPLKVSIHGVKAEKTHIFLHAR